MSSGSQPYTAQAETVDMVESTDIIMDGGIESHDTAINGQGFAEQNHFLTTATMQNGLREHKTTGSREANTEDNPLVTASNGTNNTPENSKSSSTKNGTLKKRGGVHSPQAPSNGVDNTAANKFNTPVHLRATPDSQVSTGFGTSIAASDGKNERSGVKPLSTTKQFLKEKGIIKSPHKTGKGKNGGAVKMSSSIHMGSMDNGEGSSKEAQSFTPINGNKDPINDQVSARPKHPMGRAPRGRTGVAGKTSNDVIQNRTKPNGKGLVNGISATAKEKQKEDILQGYGTDVPGEGSVGKDNRKRGRGPSPSPPRDPKRLRRDAPKPVPCCTECAMYYNVFPRLVCTKAYNPKGPCLPCVIGNKQCVPADSQHTGQANGETEQLLYDLQRAATAHDNARTAKHRAKLDSRQHEWKRVVYAQSLAIGARMMDKDAQNEFTVDWASNQKSFTTAAFDALHQLKSQRSTYDLNQGHSLSELKYNKPSHMEVALAHLKGTKASVPCNNCKDHLGIFADCVTVNFANNSKGLGGCCTNCALKKTKKQCSQMYARQKSEEL